jgi:hypothetical protein
VVVEPLETWVTPPTFQTFSLENRPPQLYGVYVPSARHTDVATSALVGENIKLKPGTAKVLLPTYRTLLLHPSL